MASRAFSVATSNITSQLVLGANLNFDATQSTKISDPGANTLSIFTSSQERLRVDASGNVGIGTSSAAAKLVIEGGTSSDQMRMGNGSNYYKIGRETTSTGYLDFYGTQPGAYGYSFGGIDGTRMVIDGSGNVGIGTASPAHKLQVNGNIVTTDGTTTARIVTSGGVGLVSTLTNHPLAFQTNDTERVRIDTAGRITTPYQPAFHATSSSTPTSGAEWVFNSAAFNRGGHFNGSTGRFTAPVAGVYYFYVYGLPAYGDVSDIRIALKVNSGTYAGCRYILTKYSGSWQTISGRAVMSLNANDYVSPWIDAAGAAYHGDAGYTGFGGYLLG